MQTEHEFVCSGGQTEGRHATQSTVLFAKLGESPEPPECGLCGSKMKKVVTKPIFNMRKW